MKKIILPFMCLALLISCEEKSNDENLLFLSEENLHMDNYYLFLSNRNLYETVTRSIEADSSKNNKNHELAEKLNEINDRISREFQHIRSEFISNLNGNSSLEAADTIKLSLLENKNNTEFTNKYYHETFKAKLTEFISIENELEKFNASCDLGSVNEIWIESPKLTAKDFIVNLTLTENRLTKKVSCLYYKTFN